MKLDTALYGALGILAAGVLVVVVSTPMLAGMDDETVEAVATTCAAFWCSGNAWHEQPATMMVGVFLMVSGAAFLARVITLVKARGGA